ncbi:hypothetical protein EGW08_011642 [Elysia chlorotica]|uniref:Uncharacterized protein n=1 Tax=Elysia chlorotica TaxID=188477 RepID=A0A3S0ZLK1_ELYCH|nr:hypothetical protein EGW08_011642 [Elysia chlorotica]
MRDNSNKVKRATMIFFTVLLIVQIKAADSTPVVEALTSMLSGCYSNIEQYERDQANNVSATEKHLWLQLCYTQVNVTILSPALTVYYEQYVNNGSTPSRRQILAFSETTSKRVRMASYTILNATKLSEGGPENLPLSDLSNRYECDALWEQLDAGLYTSYLATPQQCTFSFFGQLVRPEGTRNLTCSGMTLVEVFVTVNGNDVVSGTYEPYNLLKTVNDCQDVTTPVPSRVARTRSMCMLGLGLLATLIST